ncbi:PrpF domain-containing protein [Paraburkholderia sediminicola]|uniref:PrpF domain-containing protein n=1 Tax=Paraburkholderia sediminicola TaxID=458836 RepID=UPI0038B9F66A
MKGTGSSPRASARYCQSNLQFQYLAVPGESVNNARAALRATYVRGGTSRAVVFRRGDLPADRRLWKRIFQSVLGSPDPDSKQLDGLGGGITSLSKVAVLNQSTREGVDVDYLFVQIEPATGEMLVDANCGNISSAVGPFAVEEGWVTPGATGATVRIFNENSQKIIVSSFDPEAPDSAYIEIAGVAGRASPISLRFEDPEGSMGRGGFPSGARWDILQITKDRALRVTLIDVTLPCVILDARDIGLAGSESYAALTSNMDFRSLMTEIRVSAALRMGLCASESEARQVLLNMPDVIMVSPPPEGSEGITARFVSCDSPHRAAPVTSSMALAAACRLSGTLACELAVASNPVGVTIHHPSGTMDVEVELDAQHRIVATSILRTARRIMQGEVLLPFALPDAVLAA